MMLRKLTVPLGNVTSAPMLGNLRYSGMRGKAGMAMLALCGLAVTGLGGCINVAAPDKPIVIELNINIRQEVIYRLAEDAANTIEENADIF
ncbi:YnbE family lipoprotein [Altererythrobacter sp.]|uniref:YnbE family lipoprotein n=1 Tax=Altererythrobacter sp. TaxID=1872480 RepID=UPI003CFD0A26